MKITNQEKLFNPNYIFMGDPDKILKGYPLRSKNLEKVANLKVNAKNLNKKFIKDGYMYLLRGAKNGQETGFYSKLYSEKKTIESLKYNPENVAYTQYINGNTPFLSATTDLYVAASFSLKQKIYILKLLIDDVYTFYENDHLIEKEYMIPDYISKSEIINSFRYDKFRQIYNYFIKEIGLELQPEDLGVTLEDITNTDIKKIERLINFNTSCSSVDPILEALQESIMCLSDVNEEKNKMLTKKG